MNLFDFTVIYRLRRSHLYKDLFDFTAFHALSNCLKSILYIPLLLLLPAVNIKKTSGIGIIILLLVLLYECFQKLVNYFLKRFF